MTSEKWHLGGSAPEIYESQLVPAIFGPWAPVLVERAQLKFGQAVLDWVTQPGSGSQTWCGLGRSSQKHFGSSLMEQRFVPFLRPTSRHGST